MRLGYWGGEPQARLACPSGEPGVCGDQVSQCWRILQTLEAECWPGQQRCPASRGQLTGVLTTS